MGRLPSYNIAEGDFLIYKYEWDCRKPQKRENRTQPHHPHHPPKSPHIPSLPVNLCKEAASLSIL